MMALKFFKVRIWEESKLYCNIACCSFLVMMMYAAMNTLKRGSSLLLDYRVRTHCLF